MSISTLMSSTTIGTAIPARSAAAAPTTSSNIRTDSLLLQNTVGPLLILAIVLQKASEQQSKWITDMAGQIEAQNTMATRAKEQAANLDGTLSQMTKADDKRDLPADVIQFANDNRISIQTSDGPMDINDYLQSIGHADGKDLDKEQLTRVQSALTATSEQASNLSNQNQIKVQQYTGTYKNMYDMSSTFIKQAMDMISDITRKVG